MSHQISLRIPVKFFDAVKRRAAFNHRSVNQELVYLIECGLASQSDLTRDFLRMLSQAGEDQPSSGNG